MRRLVAVIVVAAVAVSIAGCGGGGGDAAPAEGSTTASSAAPPPVAPGIETIADRSNSEDATVFEKFPTGDSVPATLAKKIADKEPTLILFVDGAQNVTNEVRAAVDSAIKANSGVVQLVLFDLGEYAGVDTSGNAIVDATGLDKDEPAAQAVELAAQLKVTSLPYIVMTDDQGFVVFRHRGLVDDDFLKMHMERLTD